MRNIIKIKSLKIALKKMLAAFAPDLTERAISARRHWVNTRLPGYDSHLSDLVKRASVDMRWQVQKGPFAQMNYIHEAAGSVIFPKILGSYEQELHPVIEEAIHRNYAKVLDVGCAEGYYAVGFSRSLPNAHIYAFDIDLVARLMCRKLARLNHVEKKITIGGECDFEAMRNLVGSSTLFICDCEGCERFLLDMDKVPALKQTDVLVELHDILEPDTYPTITQTIMERFEKTHDINIIPAISRNPNAYPAIQHFDQAQREHILAERPPGMAWAWMTAKVR